MTPAFLYEHNILGCDIGLPQLLRSSEATESLITYLSIQTKNTGDNAGVRIGLWMLTHELLTGHEKIYRFWGAEVLFLK